MKVDDFKRLIRECLVGNYLISQSNIDDIFVIAKKFAEGYAKQERKKAVYETLDLVERYGIEKIKNDVYNADTTPKTQIQ